MSQNALGLIEVIGMPAAIEAADTAVKSANVRLIGYEKVTGGLVTVKIEGDVGAVKAAVKAARVSAANINHVVSTLVIPRPAEGIDLIVKSKNTVGLVRQKREQHKPAREKEDNLIKLAADKKNQTEGKADKPSKVTEDAHQGKEKIQKETTGEATETEKNAAKEQLKKEKSGSEAKPTTKANHHVKKK